MSNDNAILLAVAILLVGSVSALVSLYTMRNVSKAFEQWFAEAQKQEVKSVLEQQFGRLDPVTQSNFLKLINVADPLSTLTPSDLDDRVVLWLKSITDKNPNT